MATVVPVEDPSDPRLADYAGLRDVELRRAVETPGPGGHGRLIVEGTTAIRRLLASAYTVRSILVTPQKLAVLADLVEAAATAVYVAPLEVLRAVAGFDLHRGAVASANRRPPLGVTEVAAGARTLVLLEGLNDHENLGALARSAAGLGVDGLILDRTCADPLYRRSVRVSMGEILFLPFARAEEWDAALATIRAQGFRLVALTPSRAATPIGAVHTSARDRVALLLGSEGPGLAASTLAAADLQVRIPLGAGVDSLNVGHAAAIAFYCFATARGQ